MRGLGTPSLDRLTQAHPHKASATTTVAAWRGARRWLFRFCQPLPASFNVVGNTRCVALVSRLATPARRRRMIYSLAPVSSVSWNLSPSWGTLDNNRKKWEELNQKRSQFARNGPDLHPEILRAAAHRPEAVTRRSVYAQSLRPRRPRGALDARGSATGALRAATLWGMDASGRSARWGL